ncbi:methionine ABC transporter permease [Saccharopolyspora elongata]|uniref:ABC transporter permease n=1 Tax=Saccharopolyspora elongata TaxID=2530387 RepID=A0A4R4ZFI3_9PSEU|nr:methionine ABC transporter permease [Saccharopolyspora elongata]TDD56129.1 ABC transporter permease [Saccharopolyspora elongata]
MQADSITAALPEMLAALGETAVMLLITVPIAVLAAIPVGVLLWASRPGGLRPAPRLHQVVNAVVNLVRSFPFLILLIAMIPVTRLIVGTSVGTVAVTVPLCVNAIAYLSRFVEQNLLQIDPGVIEAAQAMGASKLRTIWSVLLVEARPALAGSITIMVVSFISYSAIAGLVGGGGIGDFAIRHGYYRYETGVMIAAVVVMIVLVQLIQLTGTLTARRLDKRL